MQTFFRNAIVAAAFVAAVPAFADRRSDDANSETRNDSMWAERETHGSRGRSIDKAGISQSAGKIIVDGSKGKGGGAAYFSQWRTDWNDSFSVNFSLDLSAPPTTNPKQAAVSGIAFGSDSNDKVSLTKSYKTGVVIEARQSSAGKTIQIIARKSGRVIASSERVALADGVHNFEVSWIVNAAARTISVKLFDGAAATPMLTLNGVERAFSGNGSTLAGIGSSLFGYSVGNLPFTSSFDDFSYSGDDYSSDDSDDSSWDDSDDSNHDGIEDGDDHGGRGNGGSTGVDSALFSSAMQVAIDANPSLGLIEADVEDGTVESIFKESASTVLVVRVRMSDSAIVSSSSRAADIKELEKMAVVGTVTVSASSAVSAASAAYPGATVNSVDLENESEDPGDDNPHNGGVQWKVKLITANGQIVEHSVAAN